MGLTDLYIRDKWSGEIRRVGDDPHDQLTIDRRGRLHYYNLQNGDGCALGCEFGGYEFVPNEDNHGFNADPRQRAEEG